MATQHDNLETVKRLFDGFNAHDAEGIRKVLADRFEWTIVPREAVITDVDELIEGNRSMFESFPDIHIDVTNMLASGEFVVVEWTGSGTNTGPWDDNTAATGKSFQRRGCSVAQLRDGVIVRYRDYFDRAQMLEQLGLTQFL